MEGRDSGTSPDSRIAARRLSGRSNQFCALAGILICAEIDWQGRPWKVLCNPKQELQTVGFTAVNTLWERSWSFSPECRYSHSHQLLSEARSPRSLD